MKYDISLTPVCFNGKLKEDQNVTDRRKITRWQLILHSMSQCLLLKNTKA